MQKISVVISAYNESQKIRDCLKSVKSIADEIIVVDNSSNDGTGTIAKSYGAKVFKRLNNLMLNVNKNYGFSKARNEWVLNLDADERVTEDLRSEIMTLFEKDVPDQISGFLIPRKNIIFGKWIEHTGWYPDFQLRLFRRSKGKFLEKHVHEQLSVEGDVERLVNPMLHESYATVREFLLKFFIIYAPNEADQLIKNQSYTFAVTDFISRPFNEFIKRYYADKGYKDGLHGLVLSFLMAFYHFVVVCFVWERKKFVSNVSNSQSLLDSEITTMKRSYSYWKLTSKISNTTNPIHKSYHRFKRKLLH